MSKLKAYTLMEVMVALIIGSVVISLAVMAFLTIKKEVDNEYVIQNEAQKVLRIRTLMENDFFACDHIQYKNKQLRFYKDNNMKKRYRFHDEFVVRSTHSHSDTFLIVVNDIQCKYLFKQSKLVSSFSFTIFPIKHHSRNLHFIKQYSHNFLYSKTQEQ
jgi:prepilin-type N-terminal cleavage/methylation domain-containing protein